MKQPTANKNSKGISIDSALLSKGSIVIRGINNRVRQKIISILNKKNKLTVTQLYKLVGLPQSQTSSHLAILRFSGYVITEREGRKIYYSVNYDRLRQVNNVVGKLVKQKP